MTTGQLIVVDLLVSALAAGAWLGAGAAAAAGRARVAAGLAAGAAAVTLGRVATVVALAGAGWWFVQEKLTLSLPLLGTAGLAAALLAGPPLVRAVRTGGTGTPPGPGRDGGAARVVWSLLTAGYAAAAGLVVTLLVGYPVTGAVAAVTVALVAVASLVTWRALVPARSPARRAAVVAVAAVGLAGAGWVLQPAPEVDAGGGPPAPAGEALVPVSALRGPQTPAPGGEVRRLTLTAERSEVALGSGHRVEAWTFDRQLPGPEIIATEGDLIDVTLRNTDIGDGVTLHWHGYEVPSGEDGAPGVTQAAVAPGEEFRYRFQADQPGTYWYHTHSVSHRGVRKGLFGTLVVHPRGVEPAGLDLTVPVHSFDGVLAIGDQDRPVRHRVAPGTPVRLRLLNTDSTPRRFGLAGTAYRLVAVDGRDLRGPGELSRVGLRLAAGGRYDLSFPMPDQPVTLAVAGGGRLGLHLLPEAFTGEVEVPPTAGWPELDLLRYGSPAPSPLDMSNGVDREFTLVLDRGLTRVDGVPQYAQTVNGRGHPDIPTQQVRAGDLVRMTVVNRSLETHPWHLHGHRVLILSRDGEPVTGSPLWVDTFDVRPGEVWRVAFRADNPGLWMNHCHNLPHAAAGMMLRLDYQGVTTPHEHH